MTNDIETVGKIIYDSVKQNIATKMIEKESNRKATPLIVSSTNGNLEVVKLLLSYKANVNSTKDDGSTALYVASQENNLDVVDLLLKSDADVNLSQNEGASPLYIASYAGHHSVVKSLIKSKANIDKAMTDGATPLYISCQQGHREIAQTLLYSGAKNLRGINNQTILHIASWNNLHDIVKLILSTDKGQTMINDTANEFNETPISLAVQFEGDLELVKILIKEGADLTLEGTFGRTPIQWAIQKNKSNIAKYLTHSEGLLNNQIIIWEIT